MPKVISADEPAPMEQAETIDFDFEGCTISEVDHQGIKQLLDQLFRNVFPIDTGAMANFIIENNQVGTVVKNILDDIPDIGDGETDAAMSEDDLVVFSVNSIINLSVDRDQVFVQQLIKMIRNKCTAADSAGGASKIVALLDSSAAKVGLLVNERFINLPPQLVLQPLDSLRTEMLTATSRRHRYDLTHIMVLCKAHQVAVAAANPSKRSKTKVEFVNAEEEIFYKEADYTAQFSVPKPVTSGEDDASEGDPCRIVVVFQLDKLANILSKVKTEFSP